MGFLLVCFFAVVCGFCNDNVICDNYACYAKTVLIEEIDNKFFLKNSKPSSFGAYVYCPSHDLPSMLLDNTFGVVNGGEFGELSLKALNDTCRGKRVILINRDMSGNIFHLIYNVAVPLFLSGVDLEKYDIRIIDANPLTRQDEELLSCFVGNRYEHSSKSSCYDEVVFGLSRHWRFYLNEDVVPGLLKSFGAFMQARFKLLPRERNKIVIVNRVGTRRIENMASLINSIQNATSVPVHSVRFELLSLRDQIQLVSESIAFVGVHGAAFSFIPFAASVIEFIPLGLAEPNFFKNVAVASNVDHYAMLSERELQPEDVQHAKAPMESRVVVDVERVVDIIVKNVIGVLKE